METYKIFDNCRKNMGQNILMFMEELTIYTIVKMMILG